QRANHDSCAPPRRPARSTRGLCACTPAKCERCAELWGIIGAAHAVDREQPGMTIVDQSAVEAVEFSDAEIRRYSRHLIMPEVGMNGQRRLKASSVLIVGAGGLGSPLGMYLAAAGVGRIGL